MEVLLLMAAGFVVGGRTTVPLSVCGNRSDFSTCILAIVCDGTGVVMADEWKGMYDGCYGSFVVEGDVVFCTRR